MKTEIKKFGEGADLISVTNAAGVTMAFTNLGARVVDWKLPDGRNIVLGFEHAKEYLTKDSYPGATIGRTAGRIKEGVVEISGRRVQLAQNEGAQTLHGGADSFETKLWRYEIRDLSALTEIHFFLTDNDGANGFPGKLEVEVIHSFDEENNWTIDYIARSDKDTVFNPTGHVYFNLAGDASQALDAHNLFVAASRFVPLKDTTEIVRGDILAVTDGFDFRQPRQLSKAFLSADAQIKLVGGLDHPFLLDTIDVEKVQAQLSYQDLTVSVRTDRPSLVIFTANFGDLGTIFRGNAITHHGAITFEAQVAPGSQQIPELGDISLKAGTTYRATTRYTLEIKK
ncbi:MAG: galactose-1-epimerase [Streptococcaceae bacterium]|jgi:aldose 1-epimerase|nr:galactose-1-epimerase [Streptococcaceae bacterium]